MQNGLKEIWEGMGRGLKVMWVGAIICLITMHQIRSGNGNVVLYVIWTGSVVVSLVGMSIRRKEKKEGKARY